VDRRKRCGEERRESRYRTVHQAREPWLNEAKHEMPARGLVLLLDLPRRFLCGVHALGGLLVLLLFVRKVAEELSDRCIAGLLCGGFVKAARFDLHQGGFPAGFLRADTRRQPRWPSNCESFHILPANERDVFAKLCLVKVEQAVTMARLFVRHSNEKLGSSGIVRAEFFSKIAVNAAVFLLGRDGKREKLRFIQVAKMHAGCKATLPLWGNHRHVSPISYWPNRRLRRLPSAKCPSLALPLAAGSRD
jgi:hypothetical protein